MSADFWAGYISGAVGIVIGNPLDIIKVRLQAGAPGGASSTLNSTTSASSIPAPATNTSGSNLELQELDQMEKIAGEL